MAQENTFELYSYSPVREREEPRWKETGIPSEYFSDLDEVRAAVKSMREEFEADGDDPPVFKLERIRTPPLSKANLLILLNQGLGRF
ncbi:hypothetical protein CN200_27990 [Sinorhizobium meliloti]|uniref:hypothetical protein n=1 Tax=Rhizobium meliloti TaxID=382 RepID=UPI000FD4AA84|nr:hypothetical protein [Sinorhizobium meliloti]RVI09476.1 hypothetical protein CN200_27990 [Sinorhizobium meliloti]RVN83156.1 hypothetical protein CN107_23590 [Sinorhizobium meliloti]RVO04607.1 hypothetical protein CN103_22890 [Sinorhizobium meliloti]